MGTPIGSLVKRKEIELEELSTRTLAIDAFNTLYQFITVIRQPDGTPLMDKRGRITSHLSGIFYRTIKLLEVGIKPVYVFDGKPPIFKKRTVEEREEHRKEAERKFFEAAKRGDIEEMRKYAVQSARLQDYMVSSAKELLDAMGIPFVEAPSEGEAQAACMAREEKVWAAASQDYDALLFGAPRLVRNLAITGKRKLPGRNVYVEVKPELILLNEVLKELGISRRQLIWMGILLGTDYNEKAPGVGPKKALELVRNFDSFEEIMKAVGFKVDGWEEIEKFFMNPPCKDVEIKFQKPNTNKIIELLVEEYDFNKERVKKYAEKLLELSPASGSQSSLEAWFG